GLNEVTDAHLRSLNMVLEHVDIIAAEPHNDLLQQREDDEAYLAAVPGNQYAIYFPDGGEVKLSIKDANGALKARWLQVLQSRWADDWKAVSEGDSMPLKAPGQGPWAAV